MTQQVLTITQINEYIRAKMDADSLLCNLAVKGEISNYKLYPSGHHYFTLKDEGGALKCVMFKGNAFRMRFRPENGMKVIAIGRISVYPRDGAYQLYCTSLTPDGIGDLHAAFEQLKTKLQAQGLFDPSHKKALPAYPRTIGIVTSEAGAAVHDMLRILHKRYPIVKAVLLSVRVQGVEAPEEIAAAIRYANRFQLADLLIVGRGGGSIEDLWAFNDERVAHAIYESEIPIISAVGHEPDVTISDYVADVRAATPSNAAELAVPDQDALKQSLDSGINTMSTAFMRQLRVSRQRLDTLRATYCFQRPENYVLNRKEALQVLAGKLKSGGENLCNKKRNSFVSLTAKLDAMSPLKVLSRGYAMVENEQGSVLRSVSQFSPGSHFSVRFADGVVDATADHIKENENDV